MARKLQYAEIQSISALARMMGRTPQACRAWLSREDWPDGMPTAPPWSAGEAQRIAKWARKLAPGRSRNPHGSKGAGPGTAAYADRELKRARAAMVDFQHAVLAKKYVLRDAAERHMVGAIRAVRGAMASLAASLPTELDGVERVDWPEHIRTRFDELCERFATSAGASQ